MLNDSIWIDIDENTFELRNNENDLIAILKWDKEYEHYELDIRSCFYITSIQTSNSKEAKWKATLKIQDHCNGVISSYMRIRDHLPNITEVYKL